MDIGALKAALAETKAQLEHAIITSSFKGRQHPDGCAAKTAAIRSSEPIQRVHEVVKIDLAAELKRRGRARASVHPAVGYTYPELSVAGGIKKKDQDVTVLFDLPQPEVIDEGALIGQVDTVGREVSERGIVVGVRSQLSSVAKNFDTLMERAIAETMNLRLRLPGLVMGEVYLLSVYEYNDAALKQNRVEFIGRPVKVQRFISTFNAISSRAADISDDPALYKYERSALVLVDFRPDPPEVLVDIDQMRAAGVVPPDFAESFDQLTPVNFARDLLDVHDQRHPLSG